MGTNIDKSYINDSFDEEVKVKRLGEEIGYGNMMSIARSLWLEDMERKGYPTSGVFVPALMVDIKPDRRKNYDK